MSTSAEVSKIPEEPHEISIEIKDVLLTVKKGDKFLFQPLFGALYDEDGPFFREHAGKVATVLGFGEDGTEAFLELMSMVSTNRYRAKKIYNRFWVEFEDGFRPNSSLLHKHFATL